MMIYSLFTPQFAHTTPSVGVNGNVERTQTGFVKGGKGQLRTTKPKPSGAAQLKRVAKKRNNIRKHS